jgi:hypothetical protein
MIQHKHTFKDGSVGYTQSIPNVVSVTIDIDGVPLVKTEQVKSDKLKTGNKED